MTPFTGGRTPGLGSAMRPMPSGRSGRGGLPAGTIVLTLEGEIPVEFLAPGDRIVARNCGSARLEDVEAVHVTEHCVEIAAGSLGDTRPETELILPASQPVLLRDWRARALFGQPQAVAPIGALVDHGFVRDLGERELTLHRLIFARDQVIYAGGLEVMSAPVLSLIRPAA